MNKYERLKAKLTERGQIIGPIFQLLDSAPMLELINEDYIDYVLFDMEHGVFNNENLIPLLQTCRLIGLPSFVRVPDCTYHHISRCLDLGADGIMIPRVETLEQVKLAVESMRFPPIGRKGRGGYCQLRAGETTADFQKNRHLLIQMESPLGIQNLPEMLDRYGEHIAAVLIGPYDLSFTMGIETQFEHPDFYAAVQRVFDICIERNKSVGVFCDNIEQAKKWREMGANFMWMCTDDQLLLAGIRACLKPMEQYR
ncbi:MAG: hypothetical protein IJW16_07585 [Clostridia bacterium]|nr:hypothetical protein [Clostridia bacterium]